MKLREVLTLPCNGRREAVFCGVEKVNRCVHSRTRAKAAWQAYATCFASEKAIITDSTLAVKFPRAFSALETLWVVPPSARTEDCLLFRGPNGTTRADQEPAQTSWRTRPARKEGWLDCFGR